jgi:hypothetical protein
MWCDLHGHFGRHDDPHGHSFTNPVAYGKADKHISPGMDPHSVAYGKADKHISPGMDPHSVAYGNVCGNTQVDSPREPRTGGSVVG